jgi:NAD-dependent SIR2 family protein deacetylase
MAFNLSPDQTQKIKVAFQRADSLIISAGAGMGVDSGLPDFRGNHGMCKLILSLENSVSTLLKLPILPLLDVTHV